jgi:hypothetical protein
MNKYNSSFNLITKHMIFFNIFIIAINFVFDFIHHVVDNSFNNVLINVKDDLWCTPNSLKDSNVNPSRKQRKKEESEHAP